MNNFRYIYAFIFFMLSHSAMAGIVLGGTRIVYPAKQAEVQIALKNKDTDKRYLVQSWVSNLDDSKAPFVITPPIYKIDENRQTLLHIVYTGHEKRAASGSRVHFYDKCEVCFCDPGKYAR